MTHKSRPLLFAKISGRVKFVDRGRTSRFVAIEPVEAAAETVAAK